MFVSMAFYPAKELANRSASYHLGGTYPRTGFQKGRKSHMDQCGQHGDNNKMGAKISH